MTRLSSQCVCFKYHRRLICINQFLGAGGNIIKRRDKINFWFSYFWGKQLKTYAKAVKFNGHRSGRPSVARSDGALAPVLTTRKGQTLATVLSNTIRPSACMCQVQEDCCKASHLLGSEVTYGALTSTPVRYGPAAHLLHHQAHFLPFVQKVLV